MLKFYFVNGVDRAAFLARNPKAKLMTWPFHALSRDVYGYYA